MRSASPQPSSWCWAWGAPPSRIQPQPHTTKGCHGSQRLCEVDTKHHLKQMMLGPLIPVQHNPAWSCTCISGPASVPVGEASAASLLSTAGAARPVPPRPGEAAAKGLILQPPSPSPCFTSRSPSTDQRALRFSLRSLKCSQRATRCCQQPPAVGTGLSPPHHNHLLIAAPPAGRRLARSVDPQHRSAPSSHAGCPPWCLGLRRSPAPW